MIWALLAILGVPIWLIIGALGSVVWSRRRFRAQDDVFAIAMRPAGRESWPRTGAYGRLVRDVLVVNRGLALVRTAVYPITEVRLLELEESPRHIADPVGRHLDVDGPALEVVVPAAIGRRLDELGLATSP